jgi:hypothetical protein
MLVQDTLTGYLHEVPDTQLYETDYAEYPELGEVVYDGFGNPVGLPFLAPIAAALAPLAAKALPGILRGVTGAVSRFVPAAQAMTRALPRAMQQLVPAATAFQQAFPGALQQFAPAAQAFQQAFAPGAGADSEFAEVPFPMLRPYLRPPPPGWIPRPHPYTGLRPRRFYLRCLAWPGPRGLVPSSAAAGIPPPAPGAVAPAAAAAMGMRRHHRVRRRR